MLQKKMLFAFTVVASLSATGMILCAAEPVARVAASPVNPRNYSMSDHITSIGLIRYMDEIDVPAKRDGQIRELNVRRGDSIHYGQQIGTIDNSDALAVLAAREAEFNRASIRVKNMAPMNAAKTAFALAQTESKLIRELGNDVAYLERYRVENTEQRSKWDLENVQHTNKEDQASQEVAYAEWVLAKRDVAERMVTSPVEGMVTEVHRNRGEWVKQGESILTAIRMDRLLVEGFVNIRDIAPHQAIGVSVGATIEIAGMEPIMLDGLKITKVSPKVELDGKYMVWTVIANRRVTDAVGKPGWLLRPGMSGTLVIRRPGAVKTASLR